MGESLLWTCTVSVMIGGFTSCAFYNYHAPGALSLSLQKAYGVGAYELGIMLMLYSVAAAPIPPVIGAFMDKFGFKVAGLASVLWIAAGATIFALAPDFAPSDPLPLFYAGRVVMSIGGSYMPTVGQAMSTQWFGGTGRETTSMAIIQAVSQAIGSGLSFTTLEAIARSQSLSIALWSGVFYCAVSAVLLGVYAVLERAYYRPTGHPADAHTPLLSGSTGVEREYSLEGGDDAAAAGDGAKQRYAAATAEDASTTDAFLAGTRRLVECATAFYWLQLCYIFVVVSLIFTATNYAPYFLHYDRGMSFTRANNVTSLFYWFYLLSPVAGACLDRVGHHLTVQLAATALSATCFLLLYLDAPVSAVLLVCVAGVCFALLEPIAYTLIARTIPENKLVATGFGMVQTSVNMGLCIAPPLVGLLIERTGDDYNTQNIFYVALLALGTCICLLLAALDRTGHLNCVIFEPTLPVTSHTRTANRLHVVSNYFEPPPR